MKRILTGGLSIALMLGVVGCGGAGIDAGAPPSLKSDIPIDPNMTPASGAMFGEKAAKSAATKSAKAATSTGGETPAPPK
jgi:hypothetical protein